MESEDLLSLYASLGEITHRMLEAARGGDWELLCSLGPMHADRFEALRAGDISPVLSKKDEERKLEMIMKIMADISESGLLIEPRRQQVGELLRSAGVEQKLAHAYRAY